MTDREKIERRLDAAVAMAREGYTVPLCAEVERLIRAAAERAYMLGLGDCGCDLELSPEDPSALWDGTHYFPLVLDAPKEPAK